MCWVIGVVRKEGPVASDLYAGGLKQLYRANDSSGMATSDGEKTYLHRGMGGAEEVFSKDHLGCLRGSVGIAHGRWTTHGDINLQNTHPISGMFRGKKFYIGHNGQLTAQHELEERFPFYKPTVTTDTKFIAALISSSHKKTFEDALQYACSILKGTYSVVILYDHKIYAVRDTSGNRPLVLGVNDEAYIVSSETVAFPILHARLIDEVQPGEIVTISQDPFGYSRMPIKEVPDTMPRMLNFCLFEMIYLLHPASIFLGRTVLRVRERMGMDLFREHPLDADVVIGVPDSGLPAGRGYSKASGIPEESGIIRSHYATRVFIKAVAEREEKHRIKHDVVRELVNGKKVVVVDDSVVQGSTAIKIINLLKENGAKKIYFLSSSPPYVAPCFYGVATGPNDRRLIAADHNGNVEMIRQEIGPHYLGYLSIQGTIRSVLETAPVIADYPHIGEENFCIACFTGKYPIPL